ncbi:D-aminopeptidase [Mesorhizobium escarrei]|uniref:D-aminopeptidase n=1 Tax=Mesorhizobium escarrei TaxID=666018 RepID=A0ABM9EE16_9HYPH|nr:D-aminopeptidase [Mesorhizobium escarrei]CAH2407494.1 D-aminopeptidase [Mesorhizobium escarrei]
MASKVHLSSLKRSLDALPERFKGPGGVVGVVADGEVLARQAWGYADLASGQAMTTATRLPICSISKQFTCGVLLDLVGDPARFDDRVGEFLPRLEGRLPRVADFCNMQSGLRDYWALTVVHGAQPEGVFGRDDAKPLLARMRTTHFEPRSSYSYSNSNFRILSDLLEDFAGRSLGELYADRLFGPAGMETALLTADTSKPVDDVIGYEGTDQVGFFPATNRIFWTGDAGISASLDDMLAWERHIDDTRDEDDGLYRRLSLPQTFSDGAPARYGYGLAHETVDGVAVTGHGGALRGFRLQRMHAASKRLSVVVLLNHEADAHGAARMVLRAVLGHDEIPASDHPADPTWNGHYLDKTNGLLLSVKMDGAMLDAHYATASDRLRLNSKNSAEAPSMTLTRDGDAVRLNRAGENLSAHAVRVTGEASPGLEGKYYSSELDAWLEIDRAGTALFGRFEGLLGRGPMHTIYPVGRDVFVLSCQRSMDAPAPGDWTIQIVQDPAEGIRGLVVGCWLARNIAYRKVH